VKIDLNRDWSEFLCALIAHRVKFVLVGGHAVAGYGEPRYTEDLDVFVEPSRSSSSGATRSSRTSAPQGVRRMLQTWRR